MQCSGCSCARATRCSRASAGGDGHPDLLQEPTGITQGGGGGGGSPILSITYYTISCHTMIYTIAISYQRINRVYYTTLHCVVIWFAIHALLDHDMLYHYAMRNLADASSPGS